MDTVHMKFCVCKCCGNIMFPNANLNSTMCIVCMEDALHSSILPVLYKAYVFTVLCPVPG